MCNCAPGSRQVPGSCSAGEASWPRRRVDRSGLLASLCPFTATRGKHSLLRHVCSPSTSASSLANLEPELRARSFGNQPQPQGEGVGFLLERDAPVRTPEPFMAEVSPPLPYPAPPRSSSITTLPYLILQGAPKPEGPPHAVDCILVPNTGYRSLGGSCCLTL